MMPFDRRQFEYSRNSQEFLYSGAREYEYKLMRKIKAKALFHNSKYHVVELFAVPPYSCAVMRDGAKQNFKGGAR